MLKFSKYKAKRTVCWAGCVKKHDSKKEARRCATLSALAHFGLIQDYETQPKYRLDVAGEKVATYIADFRYRSLGEQIVEDCKGVKTAVYRIKKKLMRAIHHIDILET